MSLQLRPYQQAAVNAVYEHLRTRADNPVIVAPTGSGKAVLIAQIAGDAVVRWDGRVIVLAHVQELLEQNADKIRRLCPDVKVGIYSAGLKQRDTDSPIICAGIQSVYNKACELDAFDLAIVDEAHLITTEGDGMYRQFLRDAKIINPDLRVIGLTATPFRLKSGMICSPDHFLNHICYEVGIKELIRDGYLCPLVSKAGRRKVDTGSLHVRCGEFISSEVEQLMDQEDVVKAACAEIVEYAQDRHKVLIFAAGVAHAQHIVRVLKQDHGIEAGLVTGTTPPAEREQLINRFRGTGQRTLFDENQELKYLVNVSVLTTGFDAPSIDCVVMLRPTLSPGLYAQCLGRGFRLHPGKSDCLILDFGGNVERHGPIDQLNIKTANTGNGQAPAKECPECQSVIAAGFATCPDCGYEFPPPDRQKHEATATEAGILSGQVTTTQYTVQDVFYSVHTKRGANENDPKTMRVDYKVGWYDFKSEWVCFEHTGYARQKAVAWWKLRSPDPVPDTAERAVELAQCGALASTSSITVRAVAGEPYERIVSYELGQMPEPVPADVNDDSDDLIPF